VRLAFEDQGWEDYTSCLKTDRQMLVRINRLVYIVMEAEIIILAARYHY